MNLFRYLDLLWKVFIVWLVVQDLLLFLADKDGYIIEVIGDEDIMERVNELNFLKGELWTENVVGTNAIGTALFLNKPVQTIGAEHYGINQHSWTCSASPIHDEDEI